MTNDFRARLMIEHSELMERTDKLRDFIVKEQFDALPEIDRKDLKEQLRHMEAYADVLSRRVSRLCGDA